MYVDIAAAAELTCFKCPWTLTQNNSLLQLNYTHEMICKAVVGNFLYNLLISTDMVVTSD